MKILSFIGMVARLSASGDKVDLDGEEWPNGYEHDTGSSLDALDEIIHKAREIGEWNVPAPEKRFVDGDWSFRPRFNTAGKMFGFEVVPKRGKYSRNRGEMNVGSDGTTWMFAAFISGTGMQDARGTFAEAKAVLLRRLNTEEGR